MAHSCNLLSTRWLRGWALSAVGNWWPAGLTHCCRATSWECSTPAGRPMRSPVLSAVGQELRLRSSWRSHSRNWRYDLPGVAAPCPRLSGRRACGSSTPHPRAGRLTSRGPSARFPSSSISPSSPISADSDRGRGTFAHTRRSGRLPASGGCCPRLSRASSPKKPTPSWRRRRS
jgi:hypothetical protein